MLKIGELAKICNVSVPALRYYDSIGLLEADYVDRANGYRYYKPEKIKIFHTITHLKELDFSLDEIKRFLNSSHHDKLLLYEEKKKTLECDISKSHKKIKQIDDACADFQNGAISWGEHLHRIPFEDDPNVVGKWELCGELPEGVEFSGTDSLLPSKTNFKTLFFLPGGGYVWSYFWSKGLLYISLNEENIVVPNDYHIFSWQGETYLSLDWMVNKCLDADARDCTLIYKQIDARAYTEKQTFLYRDDVNRPFIEDIRVLGEWKTVGVLSNLCEFSQKKFNTDDVTFYINKIEFLERGRCIKHFRRGSQMFLEYTAGYVLNNLMDFAEAYDIQRLSQEEYLILEHKTGDYAYLGKVLCYYVFKKEK